MLSEDDFEAVLVNFCFYEDGANVSETVQKISTRTLLELCQALHSNKCPRKVRRKAFLKWTRSIDLSSKLSVTYI